MELKSAHPEKLLEYVLEVPTSKQTKSESNEGIKNELFNPFPCYEPGLKYFLGEEINGNVKVAVVLVFSRFAK